MKKILLLSLIFVLILPVSGCGEIKYAEENYFNMDTVITIKLPYGTDKEIFREAKEQITALENIFSVTKEQSDVSLFNNSETGCEVSEECADVIKTALEISVAVDGRYDITVGNLVSLWDIPGSGRVPSDSEIQTAVKSVGYWNISLDKCNLKKENPDTKIDLGGIAKGYALGKTVRLLEENGVEYGIVSFGGNIGLVGKKPNGEKWRVSVKDPFNTDSNIGYMSLDSGFIAVSGDYERYFEKDGNRYHHILDTETGYPVNNGVHSVAVWSENATEADALSTALFSLGFEKTLELYNTERYNFEALFVTDDGIKMTNGMSKIFTEKK
ncbi:MAG: FAD:protein FMN transferase [Clostridia bacterium]|nr:FAD:protein FMN transferase [Clostridia bacterium]